MLRNVAKDMFRSKPIVQALPRIPPLQLPDPVAEADMPNPEMNSEEDAMDAMATLPGDEIVGQEDVDEIMQLWQGPPAMIADGPSSSAAATAPASPELAPGTIVVHLASCACSKGCTKKLVKHGKQIQEMRDEIAVGNADGGQVLFGLIRAAKQETGGWMLLGMPVCRQALLTTLGISKNRLQRIEDALHGGRLEPWPDLRKEAGHGSNHTQEAKALSVDSWLCFIYQFLAEPMADEERIVQELSKGHADKISEWVLSQHNPLAMASLTCVDRRLLPHMTMDELYELYKSAAGKNEDGINTAASKACFTKVELLFSKLLTMNGARGHLLST